MSISFSGLASGLDTSSWVDSLVALKRAKVTTLQEEKSAAELTREAVNNIKSFFSSFRTMLEKVTDARFGIDSMDVFAQNLANTSDTGVITATATTEAKEATYNILVDRLASLTAAYSDFSYLFEDEQTVTADKDTLLTSLGVNINGNATLGINVGGIERGLTLSEFDTIGTFIDKLSDIGVDASYNEDSGVFSISVGRNDIVDNNSTGIVDKLHLIGVNEGYLSNLLQTFVVDTIYSAANNDTKLSELGIGTGTLLIEANDHEYSFTIEENDTLGDFVQALKNNNIDASLDAAGVFSISDAKIIERAGTLGSSFIDALGFDIDTYSKSQKTKDLSIATIVTTTTTATSGTALSAIGEGQNIHGGDRVTIVNSDGVETVIELAEGATIGSLLGAMTDAGLYAAINSDGTVEIAGGRIASSTCDILNVLGLEEEPYSAMVTGNPLTEIVTVHEIAGYDTKLVDDLGVTEGYLEVTKPDGNKFYEKIYSGQSIGDLMSDLANLGIYSELDTESGVLSITGGSFRTLSDTDVNALINDRAIVETENRFKHGTNLLECLYGAPEISLNQTSIQSTRAMSKALRQSVTTTFDAEGTTSLSQIGLTQNGTAVFKVRDELRTINVTGSTTIDGLINALSAQGISASLDADTHRLEIENATLTGGTSDLASALNLTTTISGKYKTSNALYAQETVQIDATLDSQLKLYGIQNSMSTADKTVKLYNSDGTVAATTVVSEGTTMRDLLGFVNAQEGMSAELTNGILKITNGYIENDALEAGMGLETVNKSSYVLGSMMTTTTTAAVTGETTLGNIISSLGNQNKVQGGYNLAFNGSALSVGANTTLNQLIDILDQAGGKASVDTTGRLTVDGGTLTGSVAEALGMVAYTHTASVEATGNTVWTEETVFADSNTKLSDLGITSSSLTVYNSLGAAQTTFNVTGENTLGDVLNSLKGQNIFGTISDGVISLDSAEGKYVNGDLATRLGLATQTVTTTVNTSVSSTLSVTHTGTVTAGATATLGDIGAITGSGQNIIIYDGNQAAIGTISNLTTSSTIQDMFNALEEYGITGSITEGIIDLYSGQGNYAAGSIMNNLGISFSQGNSGTVTIADTITTTAKITFTDNVKATENDLIKDFITLPNDKNITVYDKSNNVLGTVTVDNNTTFDKLFRDLSAYGIDGEIHDGVIMLQPTDGEYATGAVLSALHINTTEETTTTTVGMAATSKSLSYSADVKATEDDKISSYITLPNNKTITIHDMEGATLGTVTVDNNTTFGKLFADLSAYGVDGDISNGVVGFTANGYKYLTGDVLTQLGITTSYATETVTTTVGKSTTSKSLSYSADVKATEDDKISSYITLPNNKTITVHDMEGATLGTVTVDNNTTFGKLFADLAAYGVDGDISNGVVGFTANGYKYLTGDVLTQLGITTSYTTETVTTTVGKSTTSKSLNYSADVKATEDDKISSFVNLPSNKTITIHDMEGATLGTVTVDNNTTFGKLFADLSAYGVDGDISDGVVGFTANGYKYLTGDVLTQLGITTSYATETVTTTVGKSTTSKSLSYSADVKATEDDKISSYITLPNNKTITVHDMEGATLGTVTVDNNTTFGKLFADLSAYGVDGDISDGVVGFTANGYKYLTGDVLTQLGITTSYATETVTTTVGKSTTSKSLSYSADVKATEDDKISSFVNLPSNKTITIHDMEGATLGTVTVDNNTTFGKLFADLAAYGVDGDISNGVVGFTANGYKYLTGDVLTQLGITTSYTTTEVTTTVGKAATSTEAISYTTTWAANEDTKFSELGINSNQAYVINRSSTGEGNVNGSVTKDTTIGEFFSAISQYGIQGTINDGVILLQSDTEHYITGALANTLGIGTYTYNQSVHGVTTTVVNGTGTMTININQTQTVNSTGTATVAVTGTVTVNITQTLTVDSTGTQTITAYDTITLSVTQTNTITTTSTQTISATATITALTSSTGTVTVNADGSTKIKDTLSASQWSNVNGSGSHIYGFKLNEYGSQVNVGDFTINDNTTFDEFFAGLESLGMNGTISDGVITITSSEGIWADGLLIDTLGMNTVSRTETVTVGGTVTSTAPITFTKTFGITTTSSGEIVYSQYTTVNQGIATTSSEGIDITSIESSTAGAYQTSTLNVTYTTDGTTFVTVDNDTTIDALLNGTRDEGFVQAVNKIDTEGLTNAASVDSFTSGNTYVIDSVTGLIKAAKYINQGNTCSGVTFVLGGNISVSSSTYTSASSANTSALITGVFSGRVEGNGYKITGLTRALFAELSGADVSNLGVESTRTINSTNLSSQGGFANVCGQDSTVTNCYVKGNININYANASYIGGMFGDLGTCTISNCSYNGTISATRTGIQDVGGLAGSANCSTILNSRTSGRINSSSYSITNVGGIAGFAEDSDIDYNTSKMYINSQNGTDVGGIVGFGRWARINHNEIYGKVTGSVNVGGTIGSCYQFYNSGDIIYNTVYADVGGNDSNIGGIAGNGIAGDSAASSNYFYGNLTGQYTHGNGFNGSASSNYNVSAIVVFDGEANRTISVDKTTTVDGLRLSLAGYGIAADINSSGRLTINPTSDSYIVSMDSDIANVFNIDTSKLSTITTTTTVESMTGETKISDIADPGIGFLEEVVDTVPSPYANDNLSSVYSSGVLADGEYKISSIADLQALKTAMNNNQTNANNNGYTFYLTNDIDMSSLENFQISKFSGYFYGCGHVIRNFTSNNGGLFKEIDNGGGVYDLGLENVNINSTNVGAYKGAIANEIDNSSTIRNCYVTGDINAYNAGGIVGSSSNGCNVEYCGFWGKIHANETAGGIVHQSLSSNIANCFVKADISGSMCGGIAAVSLGTLSYNTANVNISADTLSGGITALIADGSYIDHNTVYGNISSSSEEGASAGIAAGLFGDGSANIIDNNVYTSNISGVNTFINIGPTQEGQTINCSGTQTDMTITINSSGTEHTVTVNVNGTVGDMLTQLAAYDIEGSISADGKLTLNPVGESAITGMNSTLAGLLKIEVGENKTYRENVIETTSTISGSTTLEDVVYNQNATFVNSINQIDTSGLTELTADLTLNQNTTYKISSTEAWQVLRTKARGSGNLAGYNFVLAADIDMSELENFQIDNFAGNLDGQGHVIKNLTSTKGGLFGSLGGKVSNLGMENVNINSSSSSTGGLANVINRDGTTIDNCYVHGNIKGNNATGGIVANTSSKYTIKNCSTSGTITSTNRGVGGILGYSQTQRGNIYNCVSYSNVSGRERVGGIFGFIVGSSTAPSTVSYNTFYGNVSGISNVGNIYGTIYSSYVTVTNNHDYTRGNATLSATIVQNGTEESITFSQSSTVADMVAGFADHGIDATFADGRLYLTGSDSAYVAGLSNELQDAFHIQAGQGHSFNSEYRTITTDTTFAELGKPNGISIGLESHKSGVNYASITLQANSTIGDMFSSLAAYDIEGYIVDGKITLKPNENCNWHMYGHYGMDVDLFNFDDNSTWYTTQTVTHNVNSNSNTLNHTTTGTINTLKTYTITSTQTLTVTSTGTETLTINKTETIEATATVTVDSTGTATVNVSRTYTINSTGTVTVNTTGTTTINLSQTHTINSTGTVTVDITSTRQATANDTSDRKVGSRSENLNTSSKFSELGLAAADTIQLNYAGKDYTVTVKTTDTVDDLISTLAGYGISGGVADGKLTLTGTNDGYIKTIGVNLQAALKMSAGSGKTWTSSTKTTTVGSTSASTTQHHSVTTTMNTTSTFAELGLGTNGSIELNYAGKAYTIAIKTTDTVDDLISTLGGLGISGAVSADGKLTLTGTNDGYITAFSSNVATLLNVSAGNGNTWTSSTKTTTVGSTSASTTQQHSVTTTMNTTSTFAELGLGANGSIELNYAGKAYTVAIKTTDTVDDLISTLGGLGISGAVSADGKLTLTGTNDGYITAFSSNVATLLNVQAGSGKTWTSSTATTVVGSTSASTTQHHSVTTTMNTTSTFAELGLGTNGTIGINYAGRDYTVNVNTNDTVGDLVATIGGLGVSGLVTSDGKLVLTGTDDGYITSISNNLSTLLNVSAGSGNTWTSSTATTVVGSTSASTTQHHSVTTTMNTTSTFAELGLSTNGSIELNYAGKAYTVAIKTTDTVDDLISTLGGLGISGAVSADGKLTLTGTNDGYITAFSTNIANLLNVSAGNGNTWTSSTATTVVGSTSASTTQHHSVTTTMNTTSTFAELGLSANGSIELNYAGKAYTVAIKTTDTVDDLISTLGGLGISGAVSADGKLTLTGTNDGYITAFSSNVATLLNVQAGSGKTWNSTTQTIKENTTSTEQNRNVVTDLSTGTLLSKLGFNGTGLITVVTNGTEHVVTVTADKTVDDMLTSLAGYGISGSVNDGKLSLSGANGCFIKDMSQNLKDAFKFQAGQNKSWHSELEANWINSDSRDLSVVKNDLKLTGDTKLSSITGFNNGDGKIAIHQTNGQWTTISVDASKTLDNFFNQISAYGLAGTVDSDGKVNIIGVGNVYLQNVSGGSNILTSLKTSGLKTNTETLTVNSTSSTLGHTVTVAATGTTTLENLEFADGTGITFDGSGNVKLELTTNSDAGNQHVTLTFNKTQSLYDVMNKLAEYGITASVDSVGRFAMEATNLSDFDISGALGNFLMGAYTKNYGVNNTYNVSTNLVQKTIINMTDATSLAELGVSQNGNIKIVQQGVEYTVNVNLAEIANVGDFRNMLAQYGFTTNIDSNGRLSVTGVGNSYLETIAGGSNIIDVFGLTDWTRGEITQLSTHLGDTEVLTDNVDMTRKISELTNSNGNSLNIKSGNMYVYKDGTRSTLYLDNNDTLQTLQAKLANYGINMNVDSEGKIYFEGDNNSYLTTDGIASASATDFLSKIGAATNWSERYDSTSDNLTYTQTSNSRLLKSTRLVDLQDEDGNNLGVTDGVYYIYENGVRNEETITTETTVNDFMMQLASHGLIADISENGVMGMSGYNNTYLATADTVGKNSSVVSALFEQWNFENVYTSNGIAKPVDEEVAITRNTKLADIEQGTYLAGNISVIQNGIQSTISLTADDTVGTLIDELALFGFESVINENGQLIIKNQGDSKLQDASSNPSNALSLLGIELNKWKATNTYEGSALNVVTKENQTIAADRSTRIVDELGVTTGEYNIFVNGVKYTAMISSDETIGSLSDTLKSFGIETSLVTTGDKAVLNLVGSGDSYIATSPSTANASNVVSTLFTSDIGETKSYASDKKTVSYETHTPNATEATKLTDITDASGNKLFANEAGKDIAVQVNGVESKIKITEDETVGSLLEKFRALGVEATISDGKIMLQSGYDTLTINSTSTSAIVNELRYCSEKDNTDLGGYMASSITVDYTKSISETRTASVSNSADLDTKLSLLNISAGSLTVYNNGKKSVIKIEEDDTFQTFRDKLNAVGVDFKLEEGTRKLYNGYLTMFTTSEGNLEVGSTTDTSNFSAITGIAKTESGVVQSVRELYCVNNQSTVTNEGLFRRGTVTEGVFTVGDAIITIDSNTTLQDIVSQINSSEKSNATAYWDNLKGELVIESRNTGSSFINIEAGTTDETYLKEHSKENGGYKVSNFTDIMGYTKTRNDSTEENKVGNIITTESDATYIDENNVEQHYTKISVADTRMDTNTQKLGENAKFSINGTSYTSTSNTIGSDVSRIQGVTINLKGISEGETVKLTVERDTETLANAVSDIVDSYNELMDNVDKAIAKGGTLQKETTLKMIRNQLRSLMTSSDAGATVFKNLDSIGIGVSQASASNISTSNAAIVNLSFDKDKFISAYRSDQSAMKSLLIGSDNNVGIFTKVEDLVESALKGVSGYFDTTTASYDKKITNLNEKIKKANKSVEAYKARLEAKFQSMDMIISKMNQQYQSFLTK